MKRFILLTLLVIATVTIYVQAQPYVMPSGFYNIDSSTITTYFSNFGCVGASRSGAYEGQVFECNAGEGDRLEFYCYCEEFAIWVRRTTGTGVLRVEIDDPSNFTNFDTSVPSGTANGEFIRYSGLERGVHYVNLRAQSGGDLQLDAVLVELIEIPDVEATVEVQVEVTVEVIIPEETPEPFRSYIEITDSQSNSQVVAFDYLISAGDLINIAFMSIIVLIAIGAFLRHAFRDPKGKF